MAVRAAGDYILRRDSDTAEVIWKACSSIAHGETLGLLSKERLPERASPYISCWFPAAQAGKGPGIRP